jgi:hypothetical protein
MDGNSRSIARVRDLSKQDFENTILCDRPVIVEGAVRSWPALERWTPEYLARKIGDVRIHVRRSTTHIHPDFESMRAELDRPLYRRLLRHLGRRLGRQRHSNDERVAFTEFLELLATPHGFRYMAGAEELGLLRAGKWNESLAPLREDFELPSYVPQARLDSAAMWVSAKGVRSHLHYDGNSLHNVNAQITGSKHVQLYSPAQMRRMYPFLRTNGHPYTFSQVNVRLSPVSARDYLGTAGFDVLSKSKIPPVWLVGLLRRLEYRITQSR